MERAVIEQHLARAQMAVYQAIEHVRRHKEIIGRLGHRGESAVLAQARGLLTTFENNLRLHIEERNRVQREMADFDRNDAQS